LAISNFAKDNILIEIALALLLFAGFKFLIRTDRGHYFFDGLKFKIPILGKINTKTTISRFCKTLGTLTKNGVVLVDSLGIAAETSSNVVVQKIVEDVRKNIMGGTSIG